MPDPPPPRPPSLLALPSYLASQAAKNAHRLLAAALAQHGLSLSHYAVLCALADHGPLAQQQIAGALDLDKSHVGGFVDLLVARGLATRERDAGDRRRYRVALADPGHRLLADLEPAVQRSQGAFVAALDAGERAALAALLTRVLAADPAHEPVGESPACP